MAIQWKVNIPEWVDQTPAGGTDVVYTLCGEDDNMASIKSISILNANTVSVKVNIWIDTSGMSTSSPEYSASPIYLIRNKILYTTRVGVFSSIINNATWSSKGAILKCTVRPIIPWNPGGSAPFNASQDWWAGSIILSGQNENVNTQNLSQF